ncbi:hypothetical protein V8F06_009164 [Rhypophila decipiens]
MVPMELKYGPHKQMIPVMNDVEVHPLKVPGQPSNKKYDSVAAIAKIQLCLLIASLFCGTFVMALDATIIGTAVPAITAQFNSLDGIAWYGSGYLITITAFQPTFGNLYQFVSARVLFIGCILVFEGI